MVSAQDHRSSTGLCGRGFTSILLNDLKTASTFEQVFKLLKYCGSFNNEKKRTFTKFSLTEVGALRYRQLLALVDGFGWEVGVLCCKPRKLSKGSSHPAKALLTQMTCDFNSLIQLLFLKFQGAFSFKMRSHLCICIKNSQVCCFTFHYE